MQACEFRKLGKQAGYKPEPRDSLISKEIEQSVPLVLNGS